MPRACVPLLLLLLLLLSACAAPPRDQVVLLAVTEPGGQLTVQTPVARLTLDAAYQTAEARPGGRLDAGITTAEIVQARYGAVLAVVPPPGRLFTLHFLAGATTLTPASQAEVPALLAEVERRGVCELELTGHTDQTGTDAANDALSLARAAAVRTLLTAQGLRATFVRVTGRGSRAPLVDAPGQDNAANRRVEVLIR
jgi:outer membrane protein OmpA-like peptidoglycan-associated protein